MDESELSKQKTQHEEEVVATEHVWTSAAATPLHRWLHAGSFSWFRLIVAIGVVGILFMMVAPRVPGLKGLLGEKPVTWEYRVVNVSPDVANDRGTTIAGGLAQNQITVSATQLNALGLQGWELAGSYLEMETAFPNFGDNNYVTGLRDNVRPQRLVLIFKRPVQEWSDATSK